MSRRREHDASPPPQAWRAERVVLGKYFKLSVSSTANSEGRATTCLSLLSAGLFALPCQAAIRLASSGSLVVRARISAGDPSPRRRAHFDRPEPSAMWVNNLADQPVDGASPVYRRGELAQREGSVCALGRESTGREVEARSRWRLKEIDRRHPDSPARRSCATPQARFLSVRLPPNSSRLETAPSQSSFCRLRERLAS